AFFTTDFERLSRVVVNRENRASQKPAPSLAIRIALVLGWSPLGIFYFWPFIAIAMGDQLIHRLPSFLSLDFWQ
ncbi:MAG: hypothetical protein AAF989_15165, partial [Planctomycetota bacterium]